jgi:23S rRNA pseudouridine1911/1915/1917 synthase
MKTFFVSQTTSTMDLARTLIEQQGLMRPFAVMSRVQTAGRGRGGSSWLQAFSSPHISQSADPVVKNTLTSAVHEGGLLGPCTFVIPGSLVRIPLSWLSLAVGCAVCDALWRARARLMNAMNFSTLFPSDIPAEAKLKWPNDVWSWPSDQAFAARTSLTPKKIAGILCETSFRSETLQFVSIGLGLNVTDSPAHISHAGSVIGLWGLDPSSLTEAMKLVVHEMIAEEIVRELDDYLMTERSAEQLRHLTLERSLPLGTRLTVNKGEQSGAFCGLSPEGGLLLEGVSQPILAADVGFPDESARLCFDFGNTHIHWLTEYGSARTFGSFPWAQLESKTIVDQKLFMKTEFARTVLAQLHRATRIEIVWADVAQSTQTNKVIRAIESLLVMHAGQGREVHLTPLTAQSILQAAGLADAYAPHQLGVDRALQAWVASRAADASGQTVAVVSVGTALTGVIVNAQKQMVDSFILPGPAMSLAVLHEKTARLPRVSLPDQWPTFDESKPFSTADSMLRGLILQMTGMSTWLYHHHRLGALILTGGGAQACADALDPSVRSITRIEPPLVLDAMVRFAAEAKSAGTWSDADDVSEGVSETVLQSMLRARLSRRRMQRVALDRQHFRRLGGRLEHAGVGLRLDRHLGEKFKFHTRDIWQQRVEIGEVLVEQNSPKNHLSDEAPAHLVSVKPTYVLKQGDQIWLFHPPEYEPDMMTNIEVVYDDSDAAVFCKPGNLVVHAAGLYGKNTFLAIAKKMGYENAAPVHRIDRETSGILVCARSTALRRELSLSFRDSSVKKMYLAVTKGTRALPEQFRVNLPIGPAVNSRIRLKLWHNTVEGQEALTHCVRLSVWEDFSLFACMPQTGRTNQIRIHLAAIGHWIVGDKMYHPDEEAFLKFYEEGYVPEVAEKVLLPRHWLHNTGIQFFSKPDSALGREPVIAPLTADLLAYPPTAELLKRASLPIEMLAQKVAFAELFASLLTIDFSQTPTVDPQGANDEV